MTHEELKKVMVKGIEGTEFARSISGIIRCMEAMGKTVDETLEHLEKLFKLENV